MLFNSYIFILLFLPVAIIGYHTINSFKKYQLSKVFLILMSFWFYGYFNYSYVFIIITSIAVNYILGKKLLDSTSKMIYISGLIFNISLLFYFKYFDFFIINLNSILSTNYTLKNIVLPLGISFFTFQQISYIVDCYKKQAPKYNVLDYALFVTFFPQLIAGPIVLHSKIAPQFADKNNKKLNYTNISKGIYMLSFGLAKKVLVADTFGLFVSYGFSNIDKLNTTTAFFVMLAYTFQIYFDFSGYCDIAMGIGYMFNIEIPLNFNSPYKAITILDFWKRWHLTLTRFFTNYVYIPLGGNRLGKNRMFFNIFIVFLVSGIWHGSNWTFVLWGVLHGIFSILTRMFNKFKIPKFINWIVTFMFLNLTWVIFRADSIGQAINFLSKICSFNFGHIDQGLLEIINLEQLPELHIIFKILNVFIKQNSDTLLFISIFLITLLIILFTKNTYERCNELKLNYKNAITCSFIMIWCILSFAGVSTFLYFDF